LASYIALLAIHTPYEWHGVMENMKKIASRRSDMGSDTMRSWKASSGKGNCLDEGEYSQKLLASPSIKKSEIHLGLPGRRSLLSEFFKHHRSERMRNVIDQPDDSFEREAKRMEMLSLKAPTNGGGLQSMRPLAKKDFSRAWGRWLASSIKRKDFI
jgi:hypothetical protein